MSIELIPAKCPCCGADLMINENEKFAFCQYCNSRILVQAAVAFNKVMIEGTVKTKTTDFIIKAGRLESYNGEDIDVVIPDNVIIIGEGAFNDCVGLRSVVIPESVSTIESKAFFGCSNLKSVSMPNSVKLLGGSAFFGCYNLESVTIPDNVRKISEGAFIGCSSLTKVIIPNGVREIGDEAFGGCTRLKSIAFPDSMTIIGRMAFEGCSQLENIIIPKSVATIGSCSFMNCINLKTAVISLALLLQVEGVFCNCINLENVKTFETGEIEATSIIGLEMINFSGCKKLISRARNELKAKNLCPYCGGEFGLFNKCKRCGRIKDFERVIQK